MVYTRQRYPLQGNPGPCKLEKLQTGLSDLQTIELGGGKLRLCAVVITVIHNIVWFLKEALKQGQKNGCPIPREMSAPPDFYSNEEKIYYSMIVFNEIAKGFTGCF